ncbi:hypothetical protein HY380_01815 [Candidatus Saccharibacteria bacterium]|nr:hypothetical protein [Candidatus Saccharibacteria bacterium]
MISQLPKTARQKAYLSLVLVFTALVVTTAAAVAMHMADDHFIGHDELRRDLRSLQSYANEAKLVTDRSQDTPSAPRVFAESYAENLREAVDSVSQKLAEHGHRPDLKQVVARTIKLAGRLSNQLQALSIYPTSQWPSNLSQQFSAVASAVEKLASSL